MAEVVGYNGSVILGAIVSDNKAWNTHTWSIDITSETHDVTNFDSTGWKRFIGGLKGWSGKVDMYINSDNTVRLLPSDVGQTANCKFYLDATNYLSGNAIISGWHPSVSVDGVETQNLDIQGASDISYV